MAERFLEDYSAGEFLDWLSEEPADIYIKQIINESPDGDTSITDVFNIEELKKNFISHINRYTVVERGYKLYIHDERHCKDIMMFRYTSEDKEDVQNHVYNMCDDLNKGKVIFTRNEHFCG